MELAKKDEFEVKITSKGFAFIPLINGKAISEKEYDTLEKNKKAKQLQYIAWLFNMFDRSMIAINTIFCIK